MSADKNHEQYLEQIETAVANTTMDILEKHSGDLRAMAKLVAEKQVEINRLKEFYNDDRKTIRSLRVKLNEAVDEIECIHSTLESKEGEYETEIAELNEQYSKAVQDINQRDFERTSLLKEIEQWKYWASEVIHWSHSASKDNLQAKNLITSTDQPTIGDVRDFGKEIKELKAENQDLQLRAPYPVEYYDDIIANLKEEIKELKKGDKRKLKKKVEELEKEIEGLNEHTSDYDTEVEMRSLAEKQLEELQNEHQGICSKYHADFCELEEKREEVIRLNKFKEASISQVNSHLEQIVELKEENKKLKEFCKRGRVAKKNSPLEDLYLREAGLVFNDDDELELK